LQLHRIYYPSGLNLFYLLAIRRRQGKAISAAADADAEDVFVARKRILVCEEIESTSPLTFRATSYPELAVGSKQTPEYRDTAVLHSIDTQPTICKRDHHALS
jgi:hypothetical protein